MNFAPKNVLVRIHGVEAVSLGHPVFKRAGGGVVHRADGSICPTEVSRWGIRVDAVTLVVYFAIVLEGHLRVIIGEVKPRTGDLDGEGIASFQAEKVDPRFVI